MFIINVFVNVQCVAVDGCPVSSVALDGRCGFMFIMALTPPCQQTSLVCRSSFILTHVFMCLLCYAYCCITVLLVFIMLVFIVALTVTPPLHANLQTSMFCLSSFV